MSSALLCPLSQAPLRQSLAPALPRLLLQTLTTVLLLAWVLVSKHNTVSCCAIFYLVCMCLACVHTLEHIWISKDNLQMSVSSVPPSRGFRNQFQVDT